MRVVGTPTLTVSDPSPDLSPLSLSSDSMELLERPAKVVKMDKQVRRVKCVVIWDPPPILTQF